MATATIQYFENDSNASVPGFPRAHHGHRRIVETSDKDVCGVRPDARVSGPARRTVETSTVVEALSVVFADTLYMVSAAVAGMPGIDKAVSLSAAVDVLYGHQAPRKSKITQLLAEAYSVAKALPVDKLEFSARLQEVLTVLREELGGSDLGEAPPFHVVREESGAIGLEWAWPVSARLGVVVDPVAQDSSWFFVRRGEPQAARSGSLSTMERLRAELRTVYRSKSER